MHALTEVWNAVNIYLAKELILILFQKNAFDNFIFYNYTPLFLAAFSGNAKLMNALFDYDAKFDPKSPTTRNPLNQSLISKHIDCLEIILRRGFKPINNKDGALSPLMQAISAGLTDAVEPLLNQGFDINYTNQQGNCALYLAIKSNNEELVKLLLDRGADAKFRGLSGNNAVHAACVTGNLNLLKMVIDAGADPHALNEKEQNAAFSALQAPPDKMLDILKYLYDEQEFDINFEVDGDSILIDLLPDSKRFTPEVAQFFLSRGADIQKISKTGKSIFEMAKSFTNSPEIINMFIKRAEEDAKKAKANQ